MLGNYGKRVYVDGLFDPLNFTSRLWTRGRIFATQVKYLGNVMHVPRFSLAIYVN